MSNVIKRIKMILAMVFNSYNESKDKNTWFIRDVSDKDWIKITFDEKSFKAK